jgi:hypothetical protein
LEQVYDILEEVAAALGDEEDDEPPPTTARGSDVTTSTSSGTVTTSEQLSGDFLADDDESLGYYTSSATEGTCPASLIFQCNAASKLKVSLPADMLHVVRSAC